MSQVKIRAALESALKAMSPQFATAWENAPFTPAVGVPFQKVTVAFAQPGNDETGPAFQERGYLQVQLAYPIGAGAGDAAGRAELIRATFPRGATLSKDGQALMITRTPQVLPGFNDGDRYYLTVSVPFFAHVAA